MRDILYAYYEADGASGGATGASAGATASTGTQADTSGVADRYDELKALGVPEDKLSKRYKGQKGRTAAPAKAEATATADPAQGVADPAETEAKTETTSEQKRLTWAEIMADPEYKAEASKMVQTRLREAKAAEEKLGKLNPALVTLAKSYGLDSEELDVDKLAAAIHSDDRYYEQRAEDLNLPVATVRKMDEIEADKAQIARERNANAIREHLRGLEEQAAKLREQFPDFDLRAEMANPQFAKLTSPQVGLSVEDAYFSLHREDIVTAAMKSAISQTKENVSATIAAGQNRPRESGSSAAAAPQSFSYRNMTPAQRAELRKAIHDSAARGQKIYPVYNG